MRDLFRSGSAAQFLLHGNVFDVVPSNGKLLSVPAFLEQVMFATYDVVLRYDRSRGVRATRGADDWADWLQAALGKESSSLTLTREPGAALELIDRYLLRTLNLQALPNPPAGAPRRVAVIVEFAEFVVPRGDAAHLGGPFAANTVKVLGWANDPAIVQSNIVTVLLSEGLHDLSELVVENPHAAALHMPLPNEDEMADYIRTLVAAQFPDLETRSDVPISTVAARLTGLSRVGARTAIAMALGNDRRITEEWLGKIKKDLIEREGQGLLDFIESPFTLDHVAGLEAVKTWLREDAELLKRGALRALPGQAASRLLALPVSSSHTARVTSAVVALPPRSPVCSFGLAVTRSMARMSRPAASFSPRCSSSMTTDQNVPTGFANPLPMMSKAEPWIGSNIDG